jgi:hypothetical protein
LTRGASIKRVVSIPAVVVALALAGCGGSAKHQTSTVTAAARTTPLNLPRPFASDQRTDIGHVVTAHDQGTVLATDGFNPANDGFSFENYGFIAGTELDQHDLRELFGDGVCANAPSDSCTLTPAAQQWAQQMTDEMLGGHCFGFAVTAWRFFKHDISPSSFGGTTTFSLGISPTLVSELAYGWAMQTLPSVQNAAIAETPSQEISFLTKALADPGKEVYTIGIRSPQGGHAITPIAVENLGGGQYYIVIYDNNFPGVQRAISVDTNNDTWSYNGAPNPSDPPEEYSGQGANNPMELFPLSPGLGVQPCPFCGSGSLSSSAPASHGVVQVSLGGNPDAHGHLLITTADGRRLGYVDGHLVNEIKGARALVPLLNDDFLAHPEPLYQLPANVGPLKVTLDGNGATGHDQAQVHVTGPGFGATLANLVPQPGSLDQLTVSAGGTQVALQSLGVYSGPAPLLQVGFNQGSGGSELAVSANSLRPGSQLTVALQPARNRVSVATSQGTTAAAVKVSRVGAFGSRTVSSGQVSLSAGRPASLALGL